MSKIKKRRYPYKGLEARRRNRTPKSLVHHSLKATENIRLARVRRKQKHAKPVIVVPGILVEETMFENNMS